ncbi:hypothetical protein Tco_1240459 [Tanacetum coccineum]
MEQYMALIQDNIIPGTVKPEINGDIKFEINGKFIRELRRKLFKGTYDEDAHEHVRRVLEILDLFHFSGVTHNAVILRVFPITLSGPALRWKNKLSAGLITTWDFLEKVFIRRYCLPFKTAMKLDKNPQFHTRDGRDIVSCVGKEKADQLTQMVLTNTSERVKAKMKMGKNDMKESVLCNLPIEHPYVQPTPFPGRLKEQKENVAREKEPVTPQTVHITPPDDVAPATSLILDKHLNEFREEFSDITRVAKKVDGNLVNDVNELSDIIKTNDFETFFQKLLHQVNQSSHETSKTKGEMKSH